MDNRRAKLITLYELGYLTCIDIDGEYKRRVEDVIFTKKFTKEQKNSLLEHYDWYYDWMNDAYISPNDEEDTPYSVDEAFEILKEELRNK